MIPVYLTQPRIGATHRTRIKKRICSMPSSASSRSMWSAPFSNRFFGRGDWVLKMSARRPCWRKATKPTRVVCSRIKMQLGQIPVAWNSKLSPTVKQLEQNGECNVLPSVPVASAPLSQVVTACLAFLFKSYLFVSIPDRFQVTFPSS